MVRLMNKWNMELLLLQTLFFHQGHSDDSVYCAWKEDGVCGRRDLKSDGRGKSADV